VSYMLYMFCSYPLFEAEVTNLFTENVTFFTLYILCTQFKRFCKWRQEMAEMVVWREIFWHWYLVWSLKEGRLKHEHVTFSRQWSLRTTCFNESLLFGPISMYLLRNLKDVYTGNKYIVVFRLKKNDFCNLFDYFLCVCVCCQICWKTYSLFVRL
jgi:hypothetical protein